MAVDAREQPARDLRSHSRRFLELRLRPFCRQLRERGATIQRRQESEMANAACGHGDQTLTERARMKPIINYQPRPSVLEFAGRYGMQINEQVVQASAAGESGIIGRLDV